MSRDLKLRNSLVSCTGHSLLPEWSHMHTWAQPVKALAAKLCDPSSIPKPHMVEGEN